MNQIKRAYQPNLIVDFLRRSFPSAVCNCVVFKVVFASLILLFITHNIHAQSVTLSACLDATTKNTPLSKQTELYNQLSTIQQQSNLSGQLPVLNTNAQITYQSAVTELPIKVPGFSAPEIPKLQYKTTIDANQLIYGGKTIEFQNKLELLNRDLNLNNTEVEIYQLREKANQLYFNILLSKANEDVVKQTITDLQIRLEKAEAGVRNGTTMPATVQILKVEILKANQRVTEINATNKALIASLSILTGLPLNTSTIFEVPESMVQLGAYKNFRPEFRSFDIMLSRLQASEKLITARDRPKVYGFGTIGFGRPGLNMFKEETDFFYLSGIKLSWNIYNWHQSDRDRKSILVNTQIVENKKAAYDLAVQSSIQQIMNDIGKAEDLLKSDAEIIQLRELIKNTAAAQLENGTLSASDFVIEQLALEQALLLKNLHQIQRIQAAWLYKAALGNL